MRKSRMLRWMAVWLCVLCCWPVQAAEKTGSLKILVDEETEVTFVILYVADVNGNLAADFAGIAEPEQLRDERAAAKLAKQLYAYAKDQTLQGEEKSTGSKGFVKYNNLPQGCYLVYCLQEEELDPFLVWIPTQINGEWIYDVEAEPKADELNDRPQENDSNGGQKSSESGDSGDSSGNSAGDSTGSSSQTGTDSSDNAGNQQENESHIPQTGQSVIPQYVLLILGSVIMLAGVIEVLRGRKENHE